ncbi:hypothetical protein ABS735_32165 [Streptomyces sp. MMCC 100]|uniref:hypothetical protein n=1 Tax=Streptomyces sp. MMCC 100 TaxID=3163555 RepID=UPI0035951C0B
MTGGESRSSTARVLIDEIEGHLLVAAREEGRTAAERAGRLRGEYEERCRALRRRLLGRARCAGVLLLERVQSGPVPYVVLARMCEPARHG